MDGQQAITFISFQERAWDMDSKQANIPQ